MPLDSVEIQELQKKLQKFSNSAYLRPETRDPGFEAYRDSMRLFKKIALVSGLLALACIAYIGVNQYLQPQASVYASMPNGEAHQLKVK